MKLLLKNYGKNGIATRDKDVKIATFLAADYLNQISCDICMVQIPNINTSVPSRSDYPQTDQIESSQIDQINPFLAQTRLALKPQISTNLQIRGADLLGKCWMMKKMAFYLWASGAFKEVECTGHLRSRNLEA